MPAIQFFTLSPLSRALKLLSIVPYLVISEHSMAATEFLNGRTLDIDGATELKNYQLINNSTLNANGAQTQDIQLSASTLNLTGCQVQGTNANGVQLQASTATITGGAISSDRIGLVLSHDTANTRGSTAQVSGSTITGT